MAAQKKLLLIFPPLSIPTSPPLGMAMLKGYVERELADWQVQVLDLNLWTFDLLLDWLRCEQLHLTAEAVRRIGGDAAAVAAAVAVFRGQDAGQALFNDGPTYDQAGRILLELTALFSEVLLGDVEAWEASGTLSPLLAAMVGRIREENPDALGISAIFTHQLPLGAMLGRFFRQSQGVPVVFGGGCFTEGVADFLRAYPQAADAVVSGDGEDVLKTLLHNGMSPRGVAGAFYLCDGEVKSLPAVFKREVDSYGLPDFSDYDLAAYYSPQPVVPVLLSRGCYWRKCTFCVHYFSAGDSYRVRSVEQAVALFRGLSAQGVRHFSIVDEMLPPGYFAQLAEAICDSELDIAYYALSKPNRSFTPRILQKMAQSGCRYVLWGVESGNQRVLDLMGKGTRPEDIAGVLRDGHAAGVMNHVYVICGFPTETPEEFAETLTFLADNKPWIQATHRSVFSLESGSPVSKDLARFGITETWVAKETALGARLGYRTSSGMSMEEAYGVFRAALPFLKSFNPHAQLLDYYRDHALLVYDNWARRCPA